MSDEPYSFLIVAGDVPSSGKHFNLRPNEADRAQIAVDLEIPAVNALDAEVEVRHAHGEGYRIGGTLSASVVQTCVVTLEPVMQEVREEIDVTLEPAEAARGVRDHEGLEATASEEARIYHGGRIDLGALVIEHLALGLDPYPRAPGVEFSGHLEDDPAGDPSPFAALAKLKGQRE